MKTIKITLSPASSRGDAISIDRAIKELEKYRDSLITKNELFVKRLTEIGVNVAESALVGGKGDSDEPRFSFVFNTEYGKVEGKILMTSTPHVDKEGRVFYPHLAWEFGAGIFYNNGNANPLAKEFGMGVGKFPGQRFALNDYWWYRDDVGDLHLSQGTQAVMPMYKASVAIITQIEEIAREVFGG
jgi:hypothetical protein